MLICYVARVLRVKLGSSMFRCLFALTAGLSVASSLGCDSMTPPTQRPDRTRNDSAPTCAPDQLSTSSGCISVGIQGCVDAFVDDDGFCRPASEKCAPGTVPKHDEGCIEVGIPDCAADFVEGDACRPTMAKCPAGTFALPQKGCVSIDGPDGCGEAPWGHVAEMPGDVHVDPSYAGGDGTGSRAQPLTTISAALQAVQDGGRIVLAEGVYDEPIEITRPIEVVGRCASRVTLRGAHPHPDSNASAIWIHDVAGAGVRGVSVESTSIGLFIQAAEVAVRDVRVTGASGNGVVVTLPGASLDLSRSLVQPALSDEGSAELFTGVLVHGGARARLTENALIDGAVNLRINSAAQEVIGEGNLLEIAAPQAAAGDSIGVLLDAGTLRLTASALVHHRVGALVMGAGAELVASRSLVSAPPEAAPGTSGVTVEQGARATLASTVLSGACDAQLVVADEGTSVDASGCLFQGAGAAGTEHPGYAIAQRGGTLSLSSSLVVQAGDVGVLASGGALSATGVVVEGTRATPLDPRRSAGVLVQDASAALASTYVSGAHIAGVAVSGRSDAALSDSLIERTAPEERDGTGGVGLLSRAVEGLVVRRSAVLENRVAGLLLLSSSATIEDTLVRSVELGTFSALGDAGQGETVPDLGDGILALRSTAQVSAVQVEGCARAGLLFDYSDGALARSRATGNRFGLVLQGTRRPDVDQDNLFEDNWEEDELTEGGLSVPGGGAP